MEILVVEDNLELREFLADALSEEYHVRAAASRREGLEAALAAPPDLALTDVMMPEFGGDRVVRALREKHWLSRTSRSSCSLHSRTTTPRHGHVVKRVHGPVPEKTGGTLSHLLEEFVERKRDLEEAIDRNRRLLRELHHRVRGNLQTIDSMVSMQLRRQDSQEGREALSRVRDRIAAIGIVHRMLCSQDRLDRIDLAPFLTELVGVVFRSHGGQEQRIRKTLDLDSVEVETGDAVACGIAVQELVSNALEHAFPGDREGLVEVSVRRNGSGEVVLRVADCGIGLGEETGTGASGTGSRGLGFEIVQALVTQIHGSLERRSEPGEGVEVRIAFTPEVDRQEAPI